MMTVAGNDDATIEIRANPSNGHSQLVFSDGTAADNTSQRGYIVYDHPDENFKFGVYDTEFMRAHSIGAVTFSKQPAFLVTKSGAQYNITANTTVTITFDSEIFDQNDDFSSNTFTAPVAGRYYLQFRLNLGSTDADSTNFQSQIATSNRTYAFNFDPSAFDKDTSNHTVMAATLADMDANDTCTFRIYQSAGLDQVDVSSSSTVSGFLAC